VKFIIMQLSPWSVFLPSSSSSSSYSYSSSKQGLGKTACSSFLGANILLNTLFSKILGLCSSPKVRDQVLHPYSTAGKITVS
jgi:hypothetical protein